MKITILSTFKSWPLARQINKNAHAEQFYINQIPLDGTDVCVVYDDIFEPVSIRSRKGGLWLFTGEPESIRNYSQAFLNQFDLVVTSQHRLRHKNILYQQTALPWHIGIKRSNGRFDDFLKYEELAKSPRKENLISVIVTNKNYTKGHVKRIKFAQALKNHFGEKIKIYGKGILDFDDKSEVLNSFKYHIVLENSSYEDYWTEKLADCFIAEALPLYYGCTNLSRYFSDEAYMQIDINNIERSIGIIEEAINTNQYEKRLDKIIEAKRKVMEEYNIFSVLSNFAKATNLSTEMHERVIQPEASMRNFLEKTRHVGSAIRNKIKLV